MRMVRIALCLVLAFPNVLPAAYFQQSTAIPASTPATLQSALAVLLGNTAISDVTMSGSVHRIAGSDDETGSVTLKALSSGAARADFSLTSGAISEIYDSSSSTGLRGPGAVLTENYIPFRPIISWVSLLGSSQRSLFRSGSRQDMSSRTSAPKFGATCKSNTSRSRKIQLVRFKPMPSFFST
jgi:hypothetical protein